MAEENVDNILPQKIWKELEEISKMDVSIQQFNAMAKKTKSLEVDNKKDENVLKKDGISILLSPKEKKRYENLGKAFMVGANDAISEIQNAIKKKEQQSLSNKDDITSKIKNAEDRVKKEKSKKGSLFKKILVAGAVLGGIYLLFSKTINSAISGMYEKIKNGMMGLGDFIKKSASSIFSFFGNMFIKASECLSGDGVLTNVMVSIVSEFFTFTLPTLLVGLSEDLIRIIDSSFESSLKFDSHKLETEKLQNSLTIESKGVLDELRKTTDKLKLSTEKDILFDNSLSVSEQERATDKALGNFINSFVQLTNGLSESSKKQKDILSNWTSTIALSLSNNNIASTAFYESSTEALRVFDSVLSFVKNNTPEKITENQLTLMNDFVKNFSSALNLREQEVKAFSEMNADDKVHFLRNLNTSLNVFVEGANAKIVEAKKANEGGSEANSILSIVKDIRQQMDEKGSTSQIIQFQEVKEIGEVHNTIKSFIEDTKFDIEVSKMTNILGNKFDMILDATNKSFGGLASLVNNRVQLEADKFSESVGEAESHQNNTESVPSDYKLMYIFNNVASSNETEITKNMLDFLKNSANHLNTITKEINIVQKLEKLMLSFCHMYLNDSVNLQTNVRNFGKELNTHIQKPVKETNDGEIAHLLQLRDRLASNPSISYNAAGGGLILC